jgi:hypothetical protein
MSLPQSTLLVLLVDNSGSMEDCQRTMQECIATFLKRQQQLNLPATLCLRYFNGNINFTEQVPLSQCDPNYLAQRYRPHGGTAICSSIGKTISDMQHHIASQPDAQKPEKVIFVVATDGEDGSAIDSWNQQTVSETIRRFEDIYRWDFLFVGANQNAYKVGTAMGIKPGKSLTFVTSDAALPLAFNAIGESIARYRENGPPADNEFFTTEDHLTQKQYGAQGYSI